jgi:hypothetical protein
MTNLLNGLDDRLCLNGSRDVIVRFDSRFRHTTTPVQNNEQIIIKKD